MHCDAVTQMKVHSLELHILVGVSVNSVLLVRPDFKVNFTFDNCWTGGNHELSNQTRRNVVDDLA